ncbi:hypothetical protein [Cyanobium sp. NIES-981]|uniref:hypothetical protein n=1 Tax=Cyanobium sp. NIES-981 TaxID=1851505 RepID=UPI0007DCC4F8|nr:hypothetical protein [Cyanobium sp. NIES-981]SBO41805.1 PANL6 [Cyanobium sp. NIES-981]
MRSSSLAALALINLPIAWFGVGAGPVRAEEAIPMTEETSTPDPMAAPAPAEDPTEDPQAASPDPTKDWRGTVEIYGFAPLRATGSVTIRGFESDVDADLGDILSALDWLTYVRGSVEKGRWGLLTDLSYVKLSGEDGRTGRRGLFTGNTEVSTTQGIYDFALRYRFGSPETAIAEPGHYSFIPYAGVRVLDMGLDVKAEIREIDGDRRFGAERSFDRTWAQPLLGFQATYFLSPKLRAFARADIGGFDFSGAKDYTGNAQLGLGYAVGNNTDLTLSWRYLGINYSNGDERPSGIRSYQNGIEMGVKFFF